MFPNRKRNESGTMLQQKVNFLATKSELSTVKTQQKRNFNATESELYLGACNESGTFLVQKATKAEHSVVLQRKVNFRWKVFLIIILLTVITT